MQSFLFKLKGIGLAGLNKTKQKNKIFGIFKDALNLKYGNHRDPLN